MAETKQPKDFGIGSSGNAETGYTQFLLKRHPNLKESLQEDIANDVEGDYKGIDVDDIDALFKAGWLAHARKGLPWAADCGMTHYVQLVKPFTVANPSAMPPGIDINDFDAVAVLHIPGRDDSPGTEAEKTMRGIYGDEVNEKDECKYFIGPNRAMGVAVPPGTVKGERIEVMVDGQWVKDGNGKMVINLDNSTKAYEEWKRNYLASH